MINYGYCNSNFCNANLRTMLVSGIGTIKAEPNLAIASLGVITENINLKEAQEENAKKTNAVINSLIEMGIPKEMIKTASFNIEPKYDYVEGKQVFRGYRVSNILSVTIKELSKIGEIIDAAVASGANRVDNISFSIEFPSIYYKQALNLAIKDAISKEKEIALTLCTAYETIPYKIIEINNTNVPIGRSMQNLFAASTPMSLNTASICSFTKSGGKS